MYNPISAFESEYVGIVIDNKDPEKRGRLKVRIPNLTEKISLEDTPWAEPTFPYSYDKQGIIFIPEIGSAVKISFLNGSLYKPIWLGCNSSEVSGVYMPEEISTNYPNRKIIKTKTAFILFDDTDEFIEVKHKSGTDFTIDKDGNIIVHGVLDVNCQVDGNVNYNVNGNMTIQCNGNYKVNATRIDLNS